jgi:hypothetical protein
MAIAYGLPTAKRLSNKVPQPLRACVVHGVVVHKKNGPPLEMTERISSNPA